MGLREKNIEGVPKVSFGSAESFFGRMRQIASKLPLWVGELYLELHRGTLTTQARTKKMNRKLENQLHQVEMLSSCLPIADYPAEQLDAIWKTVLRNQFHDILPGSSIAKVYQDTEKELREVSDDCAHLLGNAARVLFERNDQSLVVFNPTHYAFDGPVTLPDSWSQSGAACDDGRAIPVRQEGDAVVARVQVPPYSFRTVRKTQLVTANAERGDGLVLENELVRYEFAGDGSLTRAFDKQAKRETLLPGKAGNVIALYDDHPNDWDAWDIDMYYERCLVETQKVTHSERCADGAVRQGLRFTMTIGNSGIEQSFFLAAGSKRLDFVTEVNWSEKHRMLRVSFPANVAADQASFDIQYGYVKRPTHRNTSWDRARFEVPAHRYADLSEPDYGVALLNDCKYGHKVLGSVLDLCLLRSPTNPDPDADRGAHSFTYSYLPHTGDLVHSDVIAQAALLNQPPLCFDGVESKDCELPCRLDGDGISLETLKKAERDDCLVLRLVETHGNISSGQLEFAGEFKSLQETDLMEWHRGKSIKIAGPVTVTLKPFEIRTFILK
jgi:alpha-mannosidase